MQTNLTEEIIVQESAVLVSWEHDKFTVPYDLLKKIQFFENIPDPNAEIYLEMLEIDSATLKKIVEFLVMRVEKSKVAKPITGNTNIFPNNPRVAHFFENLTDEELLLLTLASHKLDIKHLSKLCCYSIAKIFAMRLKNDIEDEMDINELTVEEDDYLRYSGIKWKPTRHS